MLALCVCVVVFSFMVGCCSLTITCWWSLMSYSGGGAHVWCRQPTIIMALIGIRPDLWWSIHSLFSFGAGQNLISWLMYLIGSLWRKSFCEAQSFWGTSKFFQSLHISVNRVFNVTILWLWEGQMTKGEHSFTQTGRQACKRLDVNASCLHNAGWTTSKTCKHIWWYTVRTVRQSNGYLECENQYLECENQSPCAGTGW